jgi:hypothetical protein
MVNYMFEIVWLYRKQEQLQVDIFFINNICLLSKLFLLYFFVITLYFLILHYIKKMNISTKRENIHSTWLSIR